MFVQCAVAFDFHRSLLQRWRSRPPTMVFGVFLAVFFALVARVVSDAATVARKSRMAEPAGVEDFVACSVLLFVLLNTSFAYTNFVTTARSTLWRGLHGGIRDIVIVNLSVPFVVWCASLHEPGRMLPIHATAPRGDAAASPLAAFLAEHVFAYGASLGLCAGLLLGLHILHIARGRFDGSMSGVDVAQVSEWEGGRPFNRLDERRRRGAGRRMEWKDGLPSGRRHSACGSW